jgi:hypothetical protein
MPEQYTAEVPAWRNLKDDLFLVGIDAGKSGAIATHWKGETKLVPMPPTEIEIAEFIASVSLSHKFVEVWIETPSKGGWGVKSKSSIATFYQGVGFLLGACIAQGFAVHRVDPKDWQRAVGYSVAKDKKRTYEQRKTELYARARELMPKLPITKANADAALILYAAQRNLID